MSKVCCNDFKEALDNDTIIPELEGPSEYIKSRLGYAIPIPTTSGYELILVRKYDFQEGYGQSRKIAFCPFCGAEIETFCP